MARLPGNFGKLLKYGKIHRYFAKKWKKHGWSYKEPEKELGI